MLALKERRNVSFEGAYKC